MIKDLILVCSQTFLKTPDKKQNTLQKVWFSKPRTAKVFKNRIMNAPTISNAIGGWLNKIARGILKLRLHLLTAKYVVLFEGK